MLRDIWTFRAIQIYLFIPQFLVEHLITLCINLVGKHWILTWELCHSFLGESRKWKHHNQNIFNFKFAGFHLSLELEHKSCVRGEVNNF